MDGEVSTCAVTELLSYMATFIENVGTPYSNLILEDKKLSEILDS